MSVVLVGRKVEHMFVHVNDGSLLGLNVAGRTVPVI